MYDTTVENRRILLVKLNDRSGKVVSGSQLVKVPNDKKIENELMKSVLFDDKESG